MGSRIVKCGLKTTLKCGLERIVECGLERIVECMREWNVVEGICQNGDLGADVGLFDDAN